MRIQVTGTISGLHRAPQGARRVVCRTGSLFSHLCKAKKTLRFFLAGECGDSRPHGEDCPRPGQVFPCVNHREVFPAPSRSDFLRLSRSRCPPPARAGNPLRWGCSVGLSIYPARPRGRPDCDSLLATAAHINPPAWPERELMAKQAKARTPRAAIANVQVSYHEIFHDQKLERLTRVRSRQPVCSRPGVIRRNTSTLSAAPGAAGTNSISLPG